MSGQISGLFAAPVVPLDGEGGPDFDGYERLLDYLLDCGVEGICVGGATSEYPHFDIQERKTVISRTALRTRGGGVFLAAVGASSLRGVVSLARHAVESGAGALLLPAPHFYRYDQNDLEEFCREVLRRVPARYLIYNLPSFTGGFEFDTILRLLRSETGITGLKDSSGDSRTITRLAEADVPGGLSLFSGSDQLILDALKAGWSGAISGNINLCPELHVSLFRSFRSGDLDAARGCQQAITAISDQARRLPFPWAIRSGMELRGVRVGRVPLPVSSCRMEQIAAFKQWFDRWLETEFPEVVGVKRNPKRSN